MAAELRYVDPTRPPGLAVRAYAALAATRFARFLSRHINWKLDPLLLRLTRGRVARTHVFPTPVLKTQGARSGARRRNAIIYIHDGDLVTIAASNAGDSRHPAWYHNLRAHPDVTFGGIPMRLGAALIVGSVAITLHHPSTHHARHAAPETGNSGAEPTFAPTRLPPPRQRRGRHLENRRPHENTASGRCGHRRADRPRRRRRPHLARIHQIIVSGTQGLRNTAPPPISCPEPQPPADVGGQND